MRDLRYGREGRSPGGEADDTNEEIEREVVEGPVLSYRLVSNEVGVEDAARRGTQMGPFAQALNDHTVQLLHSRGELQKLRPYSQHCAELSKLTPPGARDKVGEYVCVAEDVGYTQPPVK